MSQEQESESPPGRDWPDTEYKYIVEVKASETFNNIMRREGIPVADGSAHVSFTSTKRLDMKRYKQNGLLRSYSVIRVRKIEEVVEEG